jgi:hypothetical protein
MFAGRKDPVVPIERRSATLFPHRDLARDTENVSRVERKLVTLRILSEFTPLTKAYYPANTFAPYRNA